MKTFLIIGGGAAGYFAAINAAELHPNLKVIILEASSKILQKVKVSGGGRCNVTNACFTPNELVEFYPRGKKELLGPFHQFMTGDTMQWFEDRGVLLKIETDNRVFPVSNSSQTIIDCFTNRAQNAGVQLLTNQRVESVSIKQSKFKISTPKQQFEADFLLIATGSTPKMFPVIQGLGHTIIEPVPSLFTFNITDKRLNGIPGLSVTQTHIKISSSKLKADGDLLVTHWGLSGPAVLKLSAWGAIDLHQKDYKFGVEINWLSKKQDEVLKILKSVKENNRKKQVLLRSAFDEIPKRLWVNLASFSGIQEGVQWAQLSNEQLLKLSLQLTQSQFKVNGKSTFKEEFVTAGGVDLKEINFRHFESKRHKNLFFAGEVLNIDAITGGFNFQNAWTGGWIVAHALL